MNNDALFKKGDNIVLEIGEHYFKGAFFKVSRDRKELTDARLYVDDNLSIEKVADQIKDLMAVNKVKDPNVISVVPTRFGIYKNIEIPSIDKEEIKQIIDLQAGAHTPYPKNEIIIEYSEVGVLHERYTKILLVIFKRDVVTKRYDVINACGYEVETTVLSSEMMSRLFFERLPEAPQSPVGMVHIDIAATDFTIISGGKCVYIRSIAVGSRDLASKPDEAKNTFLEELKRSIESYQGNNIDDMPSRLYFTGAVKGTQELVREAESVAGIETVILPYTEMVGVPESVKTALDGQEDVSLFPVIAPVMASEGGYLDLVPEDIRERKEIKRKSREMTRIGVGAMLVLIFFCSALLTDVFLKNLYMAKLQQSYARENLEVEKLGEISTRSGIIERFLSGKGQSLFVLSELFNSMPNEVYLSSISFTNSDTLTFTGTADSMSMVFSLVTELENNTAFRNVKVDFTKTRRQKNKEVADFGITLLLE